MRTTTTRAAFFFAVSLAACARAPNRAPVSFTGPLPCSGGRCGWVVTAPPPPPRTVVIEIVGSAAPTGKVVVVPSGAGVDPGIETALRSALGAHRAGVLVCEAAGIPIHARWSHDGIVHFSLGPPGSGTGRERCLQDVLPTYHVLTAVPGAIVHVVE